MSLTQLIDAPKGTPVRDWFETYFPETRSLTTNSNRELRGGPASAPIAVPRPPGSQAQVVGTAADYVLAVSLKEGTLHRTVATEGAIILAFRADAKGIDCDTNLMERAAVARIDAMRPWERQLTDVEWKEFAGLALLLGRFAEVFRSQIIAAEYQLPILQEHGSSLEEIVLAMSTPESRADLEALGRVAVEDHAHIRKASEVEFGPVFEQSARLGGADADVIYDGTLLDFKSGAAAQIVGRSEMWQLLGYLLADTDDKYRIQDVGIAATRRRRTITWPVQDYINALAGVETMPVEEWRQDFAQLLADNKGRLLPRRVSLPNFKPRERADGGAQGEPGGPDESAEGSEG